MRELLVRIDTSNGRRVGVERALREAIRDGRLPAGAALPSTRAFAADFGLSRATVVAAYEQLAIEGYLVAERGSRTRVADLTVPETIAEELHNPVASTLTIDFRPGAPDPSLFPRRRWSRSVRAVLSEMSDGALGYGDPQGAAALRVSLSSYLGRSRAVSTDPTGVSVFGGVVASMGFLGESFRTLGIERVAVEDPSLFVIRQPFELVGIELVPVPLDEQGIDVERLATLDVGAVLVTPGHQFPLGITMTPERRAELVEWAIERDAWIIEDDYDGEFRFDRRSIGSLQGLAPDRVIYAGTASKMLDPSLRLSWLVLPRALRGRVARVKHMRGGVSTIEQLALAHLIDRGDLDRHLRHARGVYQNRRRQLADTLEPHGSWLRASPSSAGLHAAVTLIDSSVREHDLVRAGEAAGIDLLGLGSLWMGEPTVEGLVLGYSRLPEHRFASALEQLGELLANVAGSHVRA